MHAWHNNYRGLSVCTKANDGVAFNTVSGDKDKTQKKEEGKKKYVMCLRCKKASHYSKECEEDVPKSNKKGSKHFYYK